MSDDLNDGQTEGGALRAQLEKFQADLKAAQAENAKLQAQVRSTSIRELFAEVNANPKGAKFYNGEPTKEALAEWLKGDGDIFATAPEPPAQTPGEPAPVTSDGTPLGYQLPPGIDMSQLQGAQALAANPPAPPAPPTGDLDSTINKLSGLSFDKPEDVATLTAAFQGLRSVAATRLAQGGTL